MTDPDEQTAAEWRMVAIFCADVPLPAGKLAVQAGHAFLSAWRQAAATDSGKAESYAETSQTKVALLAPNLQTLERIASKAKARNVSAVMITDAARTVLTAPAVTVLGLGPMSRTDCNALTRGLEML
jgi:peptidyl-tRNA hydrolase